VGKLVQKCRSTGPRGGSAFFDWAALGSEASICFNAIPSRVKFLNGPLVDGIELQVKQRAQRRKHTEEDEKAEEQKPEDCQNNAKKDADQLSAIEVSMKEMDKRLKNLVNTRYAENKRKLQDAHPDGVPAPISKKLKKRGVDIDAVNFLFNPLSFTQTVENIFHFSFLVKKGDASLRVREKELGDEIDAKAGPVVRFMPPATDHPPPTQAIVSLTPRDFRKFVKVYKVSKGDLPNRQGSKHGK
jgi:hypothetical protein